MRLTVNMKCFEIELGHYFLEHLKELTVNMKCFEIS